MRELKRIAREASASAEDWLTIQDCRMHRTGAESLSLAFRFNSLKFAVHKSAASAPSVGIDANEQGWIVWVGFEVWVGPLRKIFGNSRAAYGRIHGRDRIGEHRLDARV